MTMLPPINVPAACKVDHPANSPACDNMHGCRRIVAQQNTCTGRAHAAHCAIAVQRTVCLALISCALERSKPSKVWRTVRNWRPTDRQFEVSVAWIAPCLSLRSSSCSSVKQSQAVSHLLIWSALELATHLLGLYDCLRVAGVGGFAAGLPPKSAMKGTAACAGCQSMCACKLVLLR